MTTQELLGYAYSIKGKLEGKEKEAMEQIIDIIISEKETISYPPIIIKQGEPPALYPSYGTWGTWC